MRRAAALALLLLAGCLHLPNRQPEPASDEGDWGAARAAATRKAALFDQLDQRAQANATWLKPEVREARARRLAEWQGWSQAELDAALARERADGADDQFLVSLYTADRQANDLDLKGSIWRAEVAWGELATRASRVEVLDVDATLRTLYPFIGPFDVVYLVRAPHPAAAAGEPVLRIAGALGRLELDFGPGGREGELPHLFP